MSLLEFFRDHLALTVILAVMLFLVAGLGTAVIVAMSVDQQPTPTPAPEPTVTPTPTPEPTVTPTPIPELNNTTMPGYTVDYKEYIGWLYDYYGYNATPSVVPVFINPESYEAYLNWLNQTHGDMSPGNPDYVPGHPETANGSIIFTVTPTPPPTPTPSPVDNPWSREIHKEQSTVQLPPPDKEGSEAGILAWDAEHSRGLYPYYSPDDHAVISLRFVNNFYPSAIKNPEVFIVLKKQVLNQYIVVQQAKWIEDVVIPAVDVDQYDGRLMSELPGFTTKVYEFDIPDTVEYSGFHVDSSGNYILEISIYADNVRACWISKQFAIV
jgi:hypothetical protein